MAPADAIVWFGSGGIPLSDVRFSGRNGFGAAFFSSKAWRAFATSSSCARSAFDFTGALRFTAFFATLAFDGVLAATFFFEAA